MDASARMAPGPMARLTPLQAQVLHVAALDCPMRGKSAFRRIADILRSAIGGRNRWMSRPLANSTLEALRLFFCLSRFPDPAVMSVVRKQLVSEFDEEALGGIANLARAPNSRRP